MRRLSLLIVLFISTLLVISQERQVAFEPTGKIRSIDAFMAEKMNYFSEYQNFKEALLFQLNDSTYVLEIVTEKGNEVYRFRKTLTADETLAMQNDISEKLQVRSPKSLLNQEGRTQLLLINSIVSYSFYGSAISTILTEDFSPAIYLISAGAGFLAPLLISRNKEITLPQATLTSYGQTRGIVHGMLLPVLFSSEPNYRLTLGFGLAGSIAEGLLGYKWATRRDFTVGQAGTIGMYSDWGMILGLGATHALGFYENSHSFTGNLVAGSILAGAAGGLLVGNSLAKKDYYSQGDVAMSANTALAGAYLPIALMTIILPDNPRWYTAVGTLGSAAGLYAGDKLARKFEFSNRQAMFSSLSMVGGGLLGAGIGHMIGEATSSNNSEWYDYDPTWLTVLSAIGASVGLGAAILSYTKDINKEHKELSFKMQMNPLGFMNNKLTASDPTGRNAIPILMGKMTF
jgi:hypothetical protein